MVGNTEARGQGMSLSQSPVGLDLEFVSRLKQYANVTGGFGWVNLDSSVQGNHFQFLGDLLIPSIILAAESKYRMVKDGDSNA